MVFAESDENARERLRNVESVAAQNSRLLQELGLARLAWDERQRFPQVYRYADSLMRAERTTEHERQTRFQNRMLVAAVAMQPFSVALGYFLGHLGH